MELAPQATTRTGQHIYIFTAEFCSPQLPFPQFTPHFVDEIHRVTMEYVSNGALVESKAEETLAEEQALASLENAITKLSKEMKEATESIRRNTARIMALNSTMK
ncbi:hypothetical protein Nepgr_020578 [Nepenthes gracilis]|uniref:Uncharacterized protein n=1 Tax=Nepenthes gracilis TaxID=150966 RepID=A0AAD3SYA1_NEPGR|nr:hypothetical protein Nepgr_020578 [Nepenthes gracilis]